MGLGQVLVAPEMGMLGGTGEWDLGGDALAAPRGLPLAKDRDLSLPGTQRVCPELAGLGSLRNSHCG